MRAHSNGPSTAIIGAGQAGFAMGYFLRQKGIPFVILERAGSIAPAWRERWDSLTLFTPRRYSALPGLPFPGDPEGYPGRDDVVEYLERYAETFDLPIELDREVRELRAEEGRFVLEVEPLPRRIAGRDLFWWLTKSRLLSTTVGSRLGNRLRHRETLIGSSPREVRRPTRSS